MIDQLHDGLRLAWLACRAKIHAAASLIAHGWRHHAATLRDNPSYAAAVAGGAAALAGQGGLLDLLVALAATVVAVYAATRRAITRP